MQPLFGYQIFFNGPKHSSQKGKRSWNVWLAEMWNVEKRVIFFCEKTWQNVTIWLTFVCAEPRLNVFSPVVFKCVFSTKNAGKITRPRLTFKCLGVKSSLNVFKRRLNVFKRRLNAFLTTMGQRQIRRVPYKVVAHALSRTMSLRFKV